jgi:hypothetical protein
MTAFKSYPGQRLCLMSSSLQDDYPKALELLARVDVSQFFPKTAKTPLLFDKWHHCYLTPYAGETLRSLTGSWPSLRDHQNWKHGIGRISSRWADLASFRTKTPSKIETQLPHDAVIFSRTHGHVLVVLSREAGLVVKLQSHTFARSYTEIAAEASRAFATVGMGDMVPTLRSAGALEGGEAYYTVSEFVPNRPPLFSSFSGSFWPGVLEKHILPRLQEFHTRRGTRVLTGAEWAGALREKFADKELSDACREALAGTLIKLEQNKSICMPVGMMAGDLKPENVHYNGSRWVVLDWANARDAALLPDVMSNLFYVATAKDENPDSAGLRNFLHGTAPMGSLPKPRQESMRVWQRWMRHWLAKDVTNDVLRLQIEGSVWDWLGTMTHPWNPAGGLWPHMSPSADFLRVCTTRDLPT